MARKAAPRMIVRVLDKDREEIASFFRGSSVEGPSGFSPDLRNALLAFRKEYPDTQFIDIKFANA